MARSKPEPTLENRTNRLKLKYRVAPRWTALAKGEWIGYYRPQSKASGNWRARWRDKDTGAIQQTALGTTDDYEDADGIRVLDWMQAQVKAREWFTAVSKAAKRKAEGGGEGHDGPYTVNHAMADYRKDCDRRAVKGLVEQDYQVAAHITPSLGDIEVTKLTRRKIENWMDTLATSPRRVRARKAVEPQPYKRKFKIPRERAAKADPPVPKPPSTPEEKRSRRDTANRVFGILNAALNYANDTEGLHSEKVWQDIKLYKNSKSSRMRFLSIEDQVRYARGCEPDFRRLAIGALHTGGRYGELTHITVTAFNREAGTIFVPGHLAKNGKSRHIILTEEAQAFFEGIVAGRSGSDPMFVRDTAMKRTRRAVGLEWLSGDQRTCQEAACAAAVIDHLAFHELRHTAASTWIAAGMDLIIVAAQLGHSDTRMVEKHYGHLCPTGTAARFRSIAPKLGLGGPVPVVGLKIKIS